MCCKIVSVGNRDHCIVKKYLLSKIPKQYLNYENYQRIYLQFNKYLFFKDILTVVSLTSSSVDHSS